MALAYIHIAPQNLIIRGKPDNKIAPKQELGYLLKKDHLIKSVSEDE